MDCSVKKWVCAEFSELKLGDKRLDNRFKSIMIGLVKKSEANISSTFTSWSETKSCYRFIENDKISEKSIFAAHQNKTVERIKEEHKVLCIQDTTYLDYSYRPKTSGLDYINRTPITKNPMHGLMLHSTFAVSTEGVPLGLIGQTFVERKAFIGCGANPGNDKKKPIEQKESIRWLNGLREAHDLKISATQLIHITDREGDIYEFYREAEILNEKFIIRVKANRTINKVKRREPPKEHLYEHLNNKRAQGKLIVDVQINKKKKYRKAILSIMFSKITIPPPPDRTIKRSGSYLPNLELQAVMAVERKPPKNEEPIRWVILTNLPVETVNEAIECVTWYSYRWNIEVLHKILKSGCSIEKCQLRSGKKLKKYITLKCIVAWRIFWLTRTFEKERDKICDEILSRDEWSVLYKKFNKNKPAAIGPPLIKDVYYWIAMLGGYINRKTAPPPGIISIWKGWTRFMDLMDDYYTFCG